MERTVTSFGLARLAAAVGLLALGAGCGPGGSTETTGSSGGPGQTDPTSEPTEPAAEGMTALPSRPIAYDHFALEGAVGSALGDADGVDGADSTTWELSGEGVDVRMEVSRWLSAAEAEMSCQSSASDGAAPSLALGSPTWTTNDSVYVTQRTSCVRVTVLRGQEPDLGAAMAAAGLLAFAQDWTGEET
jgi:hypothetical protein